MNHQYKAATAVHVEEWTPNFQQEIGTLFSWHWCSATRRLHGNWTHSTLGTLLCLANCHRMPDFLENFWRREEDCLFFKFFFCSFSSNSFSFFRIFLSISALIRNKRNINEMTIFHVQSNFLEFASALQI